MGDLHLLLTKPQPISLIIVELHLAFGFARQLQKLVLQAKRPFVPHCLDCANSAWHPNFASSPEYKLAGEMPKRKVDGCGIKCRKKPHLPCEKAIQQMISPFMVQPIPNPNYGHIRNAKFVPFPPHPPKKNERLNFFNKTKKTTNQPTNQPTAQSPPQPGNSLPQRLCRHSAREAKFAKRISEGVALKSGSSMGTTEST